VNRARTDKWKIGLDTTMMLPVWEETPGEEFELKAESLQKDDKF
jgi:hypothetical protein